MEQTLIVVGGGPAGMMAAYAAAVGGVSVLLLERNRRVGRKLMITGAGRCNLTNQSDVNGIVANIPGNGKFLHSALRRFDADEVMRFFEEKLRVPLKVERGRRVFPASDRADEVVEALERALKGVGVEIRTGVRVSGLETGLIVGTECREITGVRCEDGRVFKGRAVVVATGGLSYPGTGSTGDGYEFASAVGHDLTPARPSLVPLETLEEWPKQLQGLALVNVSVSGTGKNGEKFGSEFGEMLFTHFGVSGPIILSLSREIVPMVQASPNSVTLAIDLKPALSMEELDARVQRDFGKFTNKIFQNSLDDLLPKKMIPVIVELSKIDPVKPVHQITREERRRLVSLFKHLTVTVSRPRPVAEAIVTAGGVNVKEINPQTMESKLVSGLYFAGEVVDVDAYTGGYNLQIAFSTGYVAGMEAGRKIGSL